MERLGHSLSRSLSSLDLALPACTRDSAHSTPHPRMQGSAGDPSSGLGGGRVPSRSGFRPRQSNYLRISPTTVLQMILYLEPAHVEWMNVRALLPRRTDVVFGSMMMMDDDDEKRGLQDSVLERMLLALRDRIPLKLAQEGPGKARGREKTQVDVFRGCQCALPLPCPPMLHFAPPVQILMGGGGPPAHARTRSRLSNGLLLPKSVR